MGDQDAIIVGLIKGEMTMGIRRLKSSRFNFVYKKDKEIIVYNAFSKACIVLERENVNENILIPPDFLRRTE